MTGSSGSLAEFLAMGGYAFFVWTSYGLGLVVLVLNVVFPMLRARQVRAELRRGITAGESRAGPGARGSGRGADEGGVA